MVFKHSKDEWAAQSLAGWADASGGDGKDHAVLKMKRELYSIPEHLDVDKIKLSKEACFADRTAIHIKNGLTEV